MAGLTLDAGALIAYERGEERMREILAVAYARGLVPTIPAVALAEVWSFTAMLNEPSQAVMRRIGLTEFASFDHPRIPAGHPLRPHVMFHQANPSGLRS